MIHTIVVVDSASNFADAIPDLGVPVIDFNQYLSDYPKKGEPKTRVINLCATDLYLSRGYYCSLLSEARQHRVLPSVNAINDLIIRSEDAQFDSHQITLPQHICSGLFDQTADGKSANESDALTDKTVLAYFGHTEDSAYQRIAKYAFERFPVPILSLSVTVHHNVTSLSVKLVSIESLAPAQQSILFSRTQQFIATNWRKTSPKKRARWDMVILYNPDEKTPPSDRKSLKNFVKAAQQVGIHAELITPKQLGLISQYDALFIRETTRIDHHTYHAARKAEQEGLVVMDDATSILRCCNKVFLQDAFTYNKVPAPKSAFVSVNDEGSRARLIEQFGFPMVLKLPESSFSIGVFKVDDEAQLKDKLDLMLAQSALVLIQEFIFTEYDWRIGVLNGRAIYACRYYMARNHWQIYNHSSKKNFSGTFETLPTFEVPKPVLDAAIKASAIVGRGLYGVDVKQSNNQVYVIEVNDNPSLESKVEDLYLGKELYMIIMQEFANRLEARGR
ncbi:RimK family protein [Glaciecola siphonariae]|uniref:RimK family protein n=1 Tax=Glaciecola siphonariae TaxID=521012 RepID=A0ABV9LRV2_9ALTE